MNDLPRLDDSALAELRDIMEDDFATLVQTFRADSRSRLETLRTAHADGDFEQLARTAHSFKGSCINMGAPRLSDCCSELEQAGKARDPAAAALGLKAVQQEFAEVDRCLQQL